VSTIFEKEHLPDTVYGTEVIDKSIVQSIIIATYPVTVTVNNAMLVQCISALSARSPPQNIYSCKWLTALRWP